MNKLHLRNLLITGLFLFIATCSADCQGLRKNVVKKTERELFRKSGSNRKEVKVKESRKVTGSKKKQEAKERKRKKDYTRAIKSSQKRTYEIQSPEVKARMKLNQKESASRNKIKKKREKSNSKKARRKFN
jgi:hypothetical protein